MSGSMKLTRSFARGSLVSRLFNYKFEEDTLRLMTVAVCGLKILTDLVIGASITW